jgi:hypothetical protein
VTSPIRVPHSKQILGYYVLIRVGHGAAWCSDWDGELYATWDEAAASARDAASGEFGYEAVVCGLLAQSTLLKPTVTA